MAAAGSGDRLGAGGPKAFVPVAGRPLVEWSLDAFRACESVRSIVVAVPPGHVGELGGHDLAVVPGGATRAESVANALEAVGTGYVAIHDAARPLLTPELVEALVADLDAAPEAAGAIAAGPVTDTVKRAVEKTSAELSTSGVPNSALVIERTEDRSELWAAQTPQVFRTAALRKALAAAERPQEATDEAMLV
ncbi:MAG TPA: 2-C-methyl-D-erythritol 4-phosphate cytidylyltransferase, partial [Solirubrobacterales bacterium]|nr:2-C-methyl-D-erythritol 4-phosphate cytidylyltransferase [Solirubrobacterales bacterium]